MMFISVVNLLIHLWVLFWFFPCMFVSKRWWWSGVQTCLMQNISPLKDFLKCVPFSVPKTSRVFSLKKSHFKKKDLIVFVK